VEILTLGQSSEPQLKFDLEQAAASGLTSQIDWIQLQRYDSLLALAPVQDTDLLTLVFQHEAELYAPLRQQLFYVGVLIIILSGVQTAGIILLLRPLAGQAWTRAKHLQNLAQKLQSACEQSPVSIVITDLQGRIEYVNPKFEQTTGYTLEEAIGKNPRMLKSGRTSSQDYRDLWQTITAGKTWHGQFHNRRKTGELFWESVSISPIRDEVGKITHFVGVKEDITARKKDEEALFLQANYDLLTGLPNRKLAFERLEKSIIEARLKYTQVAVIFLDLDQFKQVNDSLGHDVGDQLLQQIAQRLQQTLRSTDTVARLGGDEFVIIVPDLTTPTTIEPIAHKILAVVSQPLLLKNEEIIVSASLGIAFYPKDSDEPARLIQQSDTAMYASKRQGSNAFSFFSRAMNDAAQAHLRLESRLRCALAKQEMFVLYQPFVELATNRVVGAEALMRWQNPELGHVAPEQFIAIAEETGIIHTLGQWILTTACQEATLWSTEDAALWVAVNLSPYQLRDPNFLAIALAAIEQAGLPAGCLELEITEQQFMERIPHIKRILNQLRSHHIHLAVDDFGTGYSSLSYLRQYPFTTVKIDRTFIQDLPHNPEAVSLVKATLAIAKELHLKTIAEGIETHQQLSFLAEHGCDYGQGYWFSKPVLGEEFRQFIAQRARGKVVQSSC
jgi:diguanylate cyclase (GGDEF)-like protein/PAS domain S-box-containing protein